MTSITFNDKNSWTDFGFYLEEKTINPPSKTKILETVPYMSGSYDFSTVGSNGDIIYNTRTVTVKLGILNCNSMEDLQTQYTQIISWLLDVGQSQLIFSFMPNYYFLAEVQDAPTLEDFMDNGDLTVVFVCEPFRYNVNLYGNDVWDTFDFDTDYTAYNNTYTINGTTQVIVGNGGRPVTPIITVTTPMTLKINNITYNLVKGDNTVYGLKLQNGENTLIFTGQGNATINFREEAI